MDSLEEGDLYCFSGTIGKNITERVMLCLRVLLLLCVY